MSSAFRRLDFPVEGPVRPLMKVGLNEENTPASGQWGKSMPISSSTRVRNLNRIRIWIEIDQRTGAASAEACVAIAAFGRKSTNPQAHHCSGLR